MATPLDWHRMRLSYPFLKRAGEVILAGMLLLLLGPLMLLTAFAIYLESGRPVLFIQTRSGRYGQPFRIFKFRTLHPGDHDLQKPHEMATGTGKVLRRWGLDELPQLWCVLKGEMSLVGPRPPVPAEVDQYTLADRRRLEAIPGLTCIWQVKGRGDIPFDEQVELDVQYIESQSFLLDLKLLFLTVPAVLLGRGAY